MVQFQSVAQNTNVLNTGIDRLKDESVILNVDTSDHMDEDCLNENLNVSSAQSSNNKGTCCVLSIVILAVIVFGGGAGIFYSIGFTRHCNLFNQTSSCKMRLDWWLKVMRPNVLIYA